MKSEAERYRYWAFISYSHADEGWAKWLHRAIETWRVPQRLVGQPHPDGEIPRRLHPLFRDRDELSSSAELGGVLNQALRESRYLIVICSPRAAASRWIDEEVRYFKSLGRESRVLAVIVDGEPGSGDGECFPLALRRRVGGDGQLIADAVVEPVAADARPQGDGRDDALLRLLAGMLGVGFDDLRQRERRRRFWQRAQQAGAVVTLLLAVSGTWTAFERYKREQRLAAHVEAVYEAGREELLAGRDMRAAVYLAEAYRLGHDTPALRFMLGRAMAPLDAQLPARIDTAGPVRRPVYSPDGARLVAPEDHPLHEGANSNTYVPRVDRAQIWDAGSGRALAVLKGLPNDPRVVRWLADGRHLLISGFDGGGERGTPDPWARTGANTGIWDTLTGRRRAHFGGHAGPVGEPLDPTGDRVLLADRADGAVEVRRWADASLQFRLAAAGAARAASFSPDAQLIASGGDDGTVRLWSGRDGHAAGVLPGRLPEGVMSVLFTPRGDRVIGVGREGDVRVWDVSSRQLDLAFAGDASGIIDLRVSGDGRQLLVIGRNGYKLWDLQRGLQRFDLPISLFGLAAAELLPGNLGLVTDQGEWWQLAGRRRNTTFEHTHVSLSGLASSADGSRLALADWNGHIRQWRLPIHQRGEHAYPGRILAATWIEPRRQLAIGGDGGAIHLVDVDGVRPPQVWHQLAPALRSLAADDQGRRLATGDDHGRLRLWRLDDRQLTCDIDAGPGRVFRIAFVNRGQAVLALANTADGTRARASVWDSADCTVQAELAHPCPVFESVVATDDTSFLTACGDGRAWQWDIRTLRLLRQVTPDSSAFVGMGYRGDSPWLIVQRAPSGELAWLDLDGGEPIDHLPLPAGDPAWDALVLPDGRWATITEAGRLYLKDGPGSPPVLAGTLDEGAVELLPLGTQLMLSLGYDGRVRAWDSARKQPIALLAAHDNLVWGGHLDAAQGLFMSTGFDGAMRTWDLRSETRSAHEIQAVLACRSAWGLQGGTLKPREPDHREAACQ